MTRPLVLFLFAALCVGIPCANAVDAPLAASPETMTAAVETHADLQPITRDLGRNLAYHRIRRLPDDLAAIDATRRQPRIIDLRYIRAAEADEALHAWVKTQATARTPVFILANATTSRELVAPFAGRGGAAHVLVIGAATRAFRPDIGVEISADDERRAYEALDDGADLATLLTENPDKVRSDEASLSRDAPAAPLAAGSDASKQHGNTVAGTPHRAVIPIDRVLQRAVHLHRTLIALRKL